ncbi:reverse transcriptase domain-containing protein [Tanacetum coccineum]
MQGRQTLSYVGNWSMDIGKRVDSSPGAFTVITNVLFQSDGIELYDSDCDEVPTAQASFMANLSNYDSVIASENKLSHGNSLGQAKVVKCYNCQGEGHMARQCTQPKIKRDDSWFKDDLDAYDSDCDELNTTKVALITNLSHYGADALAEYMKESQQSVNIDHLKQILSEHVKEKESLMQTVTFLKNDFKKEESRNIDREIALEKKIKQLDIIKAHQLEPKHYDGNVIKNASAIVIPDSEETLMLAEKSRSKMLLKQQDLMMLEKKVNTTPVDYASLNQLSQYFETRFVPQTKLSVEQAFWSQNSMNYSEPTSSC